MRSAPVLVSFLVAVGCVRAPPAAFPVPSDSLVSAQRGSGSLMVGVGRAEDAWSTTVTGAANGRVKLGDRFDVGVGGVYGAAGVPQTVLGRVSPRWYLSPEGASALEIGISGGVYEAAAWGFDETGARVTSRRRAPVLGGDLRYRVGVALGEPLELVLSVGPFATMGGSVRVNDPLLQMGTVYGVALLWKHPSGLTVGAQADGSLGFATHWLALNASYGGLLMVGWRFGAGENLAEPPRAD